MTRPKLDLESLTTEERLALIEQIWDSLDPRDISLSKKQREELARRLDDHDRHPDRVLPWSEARRHIIDRLR